MNRTGAIVELREIRREMDRVTSKVPWEHGKWAEYVYDRLLPLMGPDGSGPIVPLFYRHQYDPADPELMMTMTVYVEERKGQQRMKARGRTGTAPEERRIVRRRQAEQQASDIVYATHPEARLLPNTPLPTDAA